MKLYDTKLAPNARRVRIFLAEKGLSVPLMPIDLMKHEHKSDSFGAMNPDRKVPVLVLDDGTVLTESVAICRYFEELHPEPALFGRGALGKARVEMWQRRLELELFFPVAETIRNSHPSFAVLESLQIADHAAKMKERVMAALARFDAEMGDRPFAAGDEFSIADITGLCAIDFARIARIRIPDEMVHLSRWHKALAGRPSAAA
jgi:glutathione S-transferase